jgi:hypothetical protein
MVLHAVFLSELLDPAGGVDQFLLTGEERVAIRANFHVDITHRRARFGDIAARASYFSRLILWMNSCLHKYLSVVWVYIISSGELQLVCQDSVERGILANIRHAMDRIAKKAISQ